MRALILASLVALVPATSAFADQPIANNDLVMCKDLPTVFLCKDGVEVGINMKNGKADELKQTMTNKVMNENGVVWIEGDESDHVIVYDVQSEHFENGYIILTGKGGNLKVSNTVQLEIGSYAE